MYFGVTPWDDINVKLLKEWWETGYTASQISAKLAELGYSITRNAVIGKASRMSFKQPPRGTSPKPPRQRPRKRVLLPPTDPRVKVYSRKKTQLPTEIKTNILDPNNPGISIMELTSETCHAVVKDGTPTELARYCGVKVETNKSWCPAHCELYYAPPSEQRRRYR